MQFGATSDNFSSMKNRKSMKISTCEELDAALLRWVRQVRIEGTSVLGIVILMKQVGVFRNTI